MQIARFLLLVKPLAQLRYFDVLVKHVLQVTHLLGKETRVFVGVDWRHCAVLDVVVGVLDCKPAANGASISCGNASPIATLKSSFRIRDLLFSISVQWCCHLKNDFFSLRKKGFGFVLFLEKFVSFLFLPDFISFSFS